jgi:hypothetical protein
MQSDRRIYAGQRDQSGNALVYVDRAPLNPNPSLMLMPHSRTGFEWGYQGAGPLLLSLAILLDFTDDVDIAFDLHEAFRANFVSKWNDSGWSIDGGSIRQFIKEMEAPARCERERRVATGQQLVGAQQS